MKIKIVSFLKYSKYIGTPYFEEKIFKEIKKGKNGYAGWKYKGWLKESLKFMNQKSQKDFGYPNIKNFDSDCKKLITKYLKKIDEFLPKEVFIYVFPTNDSFLVKRMGGITGMAVNKDTIYLQIYPTKEWKKQLHHILLHEANHLTTGFYFNKESSVGRSLVLEGLAENFREDLLGGRQPFTKAITKEQSKKIFKEIRPRLSKINSEKFHAELFFGGGRYPSWSGYTIGYYLVKDYLSKKYKHKKINWKEVFDTKPREIWEIWLK